MINSIGVTGCSVSAFHEVKPLEAPQAARIQRSNSAPQAMTLAQMERELTAWAKDAPPNEDRIATKEKILAAFQNPPELLALDNIGLTQTDERGGFVPHLPKCLDRLNLVIKITTLHGAVATGKWRYIPELESVNLRHGAVQFPNGHTATGTFEYIPELKELRLTEGTLQFPNGHMETGTFQYIPELKKLYLTQGTVQFPSGQTETGTHAYIPELNNVYLINGKVRFPEGKTLEGSWQYIPAFRNLGLIEGRVQQPNGKTEDGTFEFIPELKAIRLSNGTVQFPDGQTHTGAFQYTPEFKEMRLTEGTRQFTDGRIEKGLFNAMPLFGRWKGMGLVEGEVTRPDGSRTQCSKGNVSLWRQTVRYETETELPKEAPPTQAA